MSRQQQFSKKKKEKQNEQKTQAYFYGRSVNLNSF